MIRRYLTRIDAGYLHLLFRRYQKVLLVFMAAVMTVSGLPTEAFAATWDGRGPATGYFSNQPLASGTSVFAACFQWSAGV